MLENTLLGAIENLKRVYRLTPYQSKKCEEYFSLIKPGEFIYPGFLKSKLCIDIKTAYMFMEELKRLGFVKNLYEVYCMECGKNTKIFLEELSDLKNDISCDFCNKELSILEDIIVLYKVLHI